MSDSFNKLKDKWYKKLEVSGFEDIEDDEDNLTIWSSQFTRDKFLASRETKEEYYYLATNFLNDYAFKTSFERIIWEYHANAISSRDIAKLLTKSLRRKINRMKVWRIIKRLKQEMKLMYIVNSP